jgi:hypothetical protein
MNRTVKAVTSGLVAGAISLGATAGASAKQPDPAFPPFTNACLKAGGSVGQTIFSEAGQLLRINCAKPDPPGFSSQEQERLIRACSQLGANLGAAQTSPGVGQNPGTDFVECDFFYAV